MELQAVGLVLCSIHAQLRASKSRR